MTFDSSILGLVASLIGVVCYGLARRLPAIARGLLRSGTVAACGAIAGAGIRCERPLNIAVMVDVSSSTRGAAFRDERSVRTRLTPLLAGRPYTLRYFADGEQPTASEPACERTRLPVVPDADAVVLLSDGRFDLPATSPPVFVPIDPALDHPVDASVRSVTAAEGGVSADFVSPGDRDLRIDDGAGVATLRKPGAGPGTTFLPNRPALPVWSRIGFTPGDVWPENDALSLPSKRVATRRISIEAVRPLSGFENWSSGDVAVRPDFSDASVIVVPSNLDVTAWRTPRSPDVGGAMVAAVRDYGTTLIIQGPPAELSAAMRPISPLQPRPPEGPQSWTILLDASGSMAAAAANGATKWSAALGATGEALDRLPGEARVTVLAFADDVRTIATDLSPGDARRAVAKDGLPGPTGPTSLRAALRSVAARGAGASRVLLLSDGDVDLGDIPALAKVLMQAGIRLDAVVSGPSAAIANLCKSTGGVARTNTAPDDWPTALGGLASTSAPVEKVENWPGKALLAGLALRTTSRWSAYVANHADLLAGDAATPVVAAWNVGIGKVVAVAGDVAAADLADAAARLERSPVDPRFSVEFDEQAGRARLIARDADGPITGLKPTLVRGRVSNTFVATGPGEYAAILVRSTVPGMAQVVVDGRTVARGLLAGRYSAEFDAIGNDREALVSLAQRSGGAVIEAGDSRAIEWPRRYVGWSLSAGLAVGAAGAWLAGVVAIRRSARRKSQWNSGGARTV